MNCKLMQLYLQICRPQVHPALEGHIRGNGGKGRRSPQRTRLDGVFIGQNYFSGVDMANNGSILIQVIAGNVIQMPVGVYRRIILNAVLALQVIPDPLTLPGQIHRIDDDGAVPPEYRMGAAAKAHVHRGMVRVTSPIKID